MSGNKFITVFFLLAFQIVFFNLTGQNKVDAKWKEVNSVLIPIPPNEHPKHLILSQNRHIK